MKKLFFVLAVILAFEGSAQTAAAIPADQVINDALAIATKEKKKVFVMFHASWCGWCHKMDASMNDETCKKLFEENFVIRHLVVDEAKDKKHLENPGASELRDKYYGKDQGIPFWLVFDNNGKLLFDSKSRKEGDGMEQGENVGCPATEKEVSYFINVLKNSTKMKEAELDLIRKRFRQNESR